MILREVDKIYNMDCYDGLKDMPDNSIDFIVTSPPYDKLRTYNDTCEWDFEIFKKIADELIRVLKKNHVLVWIVGDATVNGGETGSSFMQALYFKEHGLTLHDTMIYEKNSSSFPARRDSKRYTQIFEYMFVFTKGKIRNDIALIADKKNKWSGWTSWGKQTQYDANKKVEVEKTIRPVPEYSLRTNIWKVNSSFNDKTKHPAVFPEKLVGDHILSWTLENDVILDPFMGSGTTAKMALLHKRHYIGFEKDTEYYNESLERISKYIGKTDINNYIDVIVDDEVVVTENTDFKEEEEKTKLFNNLIDKLNVYFNEQSLSTLKTLDLAFKSESNTKRVEERLKLNE